MAHHRFEQAVALFDAYNQQDPNQLTWEGAGHPAEYFYALQLHRWVQQLEPQASEALLLASRCQHIGRWQIARNQYPQGKAGYYQWRTTLARFHADTAAGLMRQAGYSDTEIDAVRRIVLKEHLRTDPEVQTIEDALCLVFLQFQYASFLQQHDEATMLRILRKTWGKMSDRGREAALSLPYTPQGSNLLQQALHPA